MTSSDIYAYFTTLSIVVVSVFVCWTLAYCIRILKKIYHTLDAVDDAMKSMLGGWESLLHRFTTMRDSLQLLAQGIQAASGAYRQYKKKKSKTSAAKKDDVSE